jgi:ferrous iron transport protein A
MNLSQLQVNDQATVDRVTGPRPFVRRLLSLGVSPGSSVRVIRVAPLGDPIQVEIGRLQLAIRRNEASQVIIQPAS